jgi:hypothetical protein
MLFVVNMLKVLFILFTLIQGFILNQGLKVFFCKAISLDRLAPRKPRPLGRGRGELYKNCFSSLPGCEALPLGRTPALQGGRGFTSEPCFYV